MASIIAEKARNNSKRTLIYGLTARNNTFFSQNNQLTIKIWPKNKELQGNLNTVFILFLTLLWCLPLYNLSVMGQ